MSHTAQSLYKRIKALKTERNICVLSHSYQSHEVLMAADITGDSFALSQKAANLSAETVVVCGVRFMAETVKLLSPEKKVILVSPSAGCPMAEQITPEEVRAYRAAHPGCAVVCYVNTTAALKAECDVCVTSSSALQIIRAMPETDIYFVPDVNLGTYIKENIPEKNITLYQGGCPYHSAVTAEEVARAKSEHPKALLLAHPECASVVVSQADYVGSTSGIMAYARKSEAREFIIGTENSIVEHLQYELPDKVFYPLSKHLLCADMHLTTLPALYAAMSGTAGEEIVLPGHIMEAARRPIDRMILLGQ